MANSSANRSIRCFTISSYCAMLSIIPLFLEKCQCFSDACFPFVWHPFGANDKVNVCTAEDGDFGVVHRCFRSFFLTVILLIIPDGVVGCQGKFLGGWFCKRECRCSRGSDSSILLMFYLNIISGTFCIRYLNFTCEIPVLYLPKVPVLNQYQSF